jgi:hypothetical protein
VPNSPRIICFLIAALLLGSVQSVFAQATSTSVNSARESTQAAPVSATVKGKDSCEGPVPELVESTFLTTSDVEQYQLLRDLRATTAALIPAERIKVDSAEKELAILQEERMIKPPRVIDDKSRLSRLQEELNRITTQLTHIQEKPEENAKDITDLS